MQMFLQLIYHFIIKYTYFSLIILLNINYHYCFIIAICIYFAYMHHINNVNEPTESTIIPNETENKWPKHTL